MNLARHPMALGITSFACLLGTIFTNYHTKPGLKKALYIGFVASTALGLIPLC